MTDSIAEVERIVAGLTKAQREALVEAEWRGGGAVQFAVVSGMVNLPSTLAHMFTLRWDRLTPLGLAARAHLIGQAS